MLLHGHERRTRAGGTCGLVYRCFRANHSCTCHLDLSCGLQGLAAAGLVNGPSVTGGKGGKAAGSKGGKAMAASGAAGGGGGGGSNKLTNSLQQDQLRESLDRLDSQLGALRRKMEGEWAKQLVV